MKCPTCLLHVLFFVASVAVFLASNAVSLNSQTQIMGTVVDSLGAPVALVEVTTSVSRVLTGSEGRFSLAGPVNQDSLRVAFRRVGFRPLDVFARTDVLEESIDLGAVVMEAVPVELEEIQVEALRPLLSARGIREFEFARREGFSRYFITAYDVERLRPFNVSGLTHRIPGARNAENVLFGNSIQFLTRGGGWCTATIFVDGTPTRNTDPDALVSPERVGAMWYAPRECQVHIWTKPTLVEEASSFEIGLRMSGSDYGRGARVGAFGGYMLLPLITSRMALYPAVDVTTGQAAIRWRTQVVLRVRAIGQQPALYAGLGIRFRKFDAVGAASPEAIPLIVGGLAEALGRIRLFGEISVAGPLQPNERRAEVVFGLGYHN